jgi:anaerobic ribonucleoside-triphosphate reductase activating protein
MNVRIAKIVNGSLVDGPGRRTVVFVQGCSFGCNGCQNKALWPADGGQEYDVEALAQHVAMVANVETAGQVTISGGEPFQQISALSQLVRALRVYGVSNIILYTGYTWDDLTGMDVLFGDYMRVMAVLSHADILVDGPFVRQADDDLVQWRGSRNQRPINVSESIRQGGIVVEDWDTPAVQISINGEVLIPAGLSGLFAGIGETVPAAMCGQTKGR